jgi:hypothetical protein
LKLVFSLKSFISKEVIEALASQRVIGFTDGRVLILAPPQSVEPLWRCTFPHIFPALPQQHNSPLISSVIITTVTKFLLYHGASCGTVPNDLMEEPASTKSQCFAKLCSDCNSFFEHWDNETCTIDELGQIFSHHQFTKPHEHGKRFCLSLATSIR